MSEKVYVACVIMPGAFYAERSFEVTTADGSAFKGLAPVDYFRGPDRKPLPEGRPSPRRTEGWVAARVIEREIGTTTISVPMDGVITVDESLLEARSEPTPVAS